MQSKTSSKQHRKYIRHPSDVPIRVTLNWVEDDVESHPCEKLNNVGMGGLSFKSSQALPNGQAVSVNFPILDQKQNLLGTVMWNRKIIDGFEIGLKFEDPEEIFRLRMIEQICHIEHYRREVQLHEGRNLSSEQAATEWIAQYADEFPSLKK